MEDEKIIDLLWQRSESAIERIDQKYGRFCFSISNRILKLLQSNPEIRIVTIGIQGGVCNGVVEFSDFPELDGIDLSKELSQKIGLPVYVENDMNTIALGYSEKNHQEKAEHKQMHSASQYLSAEYVCL